ncbi:MAG: phosphoribosyltransferase family protein [Wenzhouxiangellaceae bacterium]|nr:phosphoribosyltransferase family protein [Wenzhouxiangellaceae bacterium]
MTAEARQTLHLAGSDEVEKLLDQLAARIAEDLEPNTALVGVLRRGVPLARLLAERLHRRTGKLLEVGELKLKRYSDDLTLLHRRPELDQRTLDIEIEDRHLVLVDDVIFSGESMLRAICHLRSAGAARLQTALLCARGRQTMPVAIDYVGRRLDVGPAWIIDCRVPPYESTLGITITAKPGSDQDQ